MKRLEMPDEFWEDLAKIYPTRGGRRVLAERWNVGQSSVQKMAKERGIYSYRTESLISTKRLDGNSYFEDRLLEMFSQSGGIQSLCNEFSVSRRTIERVASKYDLMSYRNFNCKNLREDYFDTLDEERSYYAGYIWADGSIFVCKGKSRGLKLKCKTDDEDLILSLRRVINSQHAVLRHFPKDKSGNIQYSKKNGIPLQATQVIIYSPRIAESLIKLGIYPRKSYVNPPFPDWVTPKLLPHFVRGVFDGDGTCVQSYSTGRAVRHLSYYGSELFIHELQNRIVDCLRIQRNKPSNDIRSGGLMWGIGWHSLDDIEKLYFWMYPYDDCICLPRKRLYLERMLSGSPLPATGGEPMADDPIPENFPI